MDRLTRDRKNNLQLCGNASISVLRSFESKTGKTWLLFSNVYYISISTCKILNRYHQDIFHEFRRKRERENDEILNQYHQDIFHEFRRKRERENDEILNRYHQDIFHEFWRKREREKDEILLLVLILFNFWIPLVISNSWCIPST